MRILTRKIHRAFPELDRYSDEQCERFVRAAKRGWWRLALHTSVISLVFGVTLVGALFPIAYITNWIDRRASFVDTIGAWVIVLDVCIAIPLLAVPPIAAYLTRDRLLRRRVRYVLRTRGACHGCRYSLIGLPVDEKNFVTCPECGTESEVDAALGELVLDDTGKARYQPSAASLPRPPRIFTAARMRKVKRYGLVVAFLLVVGLPASWGGYEFWLRRQAEQAAKERPGPGGILELVEKSQPSGTTPDDPNAWERFGRAQSLLETVDARLWRNAMSGPTGSAPAGAASYPDFSYVFSPRETEDPGMKAQNEAAAALALKCLDGYRQGGVFDALREMAARPRAVRDISFAPGQPAVAMLLPELGHCRNFARINGARMRLAADRHDLVEFSEAAEETFALARICRQQPLLIDALVGNAIEALAYGRLREVLATHPDAAWLDAIDGGIARQSFGPGRARVYEGERLVALDTAAWLFSDPNMVRRGQFSPALGRMFGGTANGRLGTYVGNRDEFNERFEKIAAYVALERWERPTPAPVLDSPSKLRLINLLMPAMTKSIQSMDQIEMERRGYVTMAALERYRIAHGGYPAALSELPAEVFKKLPVDPWSGKPFGYVRLAAPDELGREYLLYSVGADGADDGGKEAPGTAIHYDVLSGEGGVKVGFDFIINNPKR